MTEIRLSGMLPDHYPMRKKHLVILIVLIAAIIVLNVWLWTGVAERNRQNSNWARLCEKLADCDSTAECLTDDFGIYIDFSERSDLITEGDVCSGHIDFSCESRDFCLVTGRFFPYFIFVLNPADISNVYENIFIHVIVIDENDDGFTCKVFRIINNTDRDFGLIKKGDILSFSLG
ncbi:MAG: hypothetical protein J5830_00715 [Clostridia bacterium]|nr:hypothetical protein [Clostridia bacterium]